MALRQPLGASDGYLMRSDATPCSLLTTQLAKIGCCGGAFLGLPFCYINYGPRFTWPRAFRWMAGGAVLGAGFLIVHTRVAGPDHYQLAGRGQPRRQGTSGDFIHQPSPKSYSRFFRNLTATRGGGLAVFPA